MTLLQRVQENHEDMLHELSRTSSSCSGSARWRAGGSGQAPRTRCSQNIAEDRCGVRGSGPTLPRQRCGGADGSGCVIVAVEHRPPFGSLKGLDFLHSECHIIYTGKCSKAQDLEFGNLLLSFEESSVINDYVRQQKKTPLQSKEVHTLLSSVHGMETCELSDGALKDIPPYHSPGEGNKEGKRDGHKGDK